MSDEGDGVGVGHRKWWGPRIWRILHSLAEVSDRADCAPAWRVALATTASMLPCALCRGHFQGHIRRILLPVGRIPRETLRHHLWAAHAATRPAGGLAEADLSSEYGCGGDRAEVLRVVRSLTEEVFTVLRDGGVYNRLNVGKLVDWHRAIQALAVLLQTPLPEAPAPPPRSSRGAGYRRRM